MCGIVGYTGKNLAVPYLIDGLSKLEYRGYDSAGVAVMENGRISVTKKSGRLSVLEKELAKHEQSTATVGIGHTRWATHGRPSDENAHPHLSENCLFAVVHNGIIENYAALKEQLESEGIHFSSQTDTEVISQLLEKNYDGSFLSSVQKTLPMLEGAYALAVLCRDEPDTVICAKKASPLVLGKSEEGIFAASDVTAVLKHTRDVYKLSDGETAVCRGASLSFYSADGKPVQKSCEHITWSAEDAQKGGYDHFMLKEIFEQPAAFAATVNQHITGGKLSFENLPLSKDEIGKLDRIVITACGSAYHTGIVGKYIFESLTRIPTEVDIASEFRYRDPILTENTLVIIISQSGETADTLAALRLAKEKGARVLSIVNVVGSTIANESDGVIYTAAGPEIAVATTKAYSTQLAVLYLLCGHFAFERGLMDADGLSRYLLELQSIPKKINEVLEANRERAKELAKLFVPLDHAYYIGRGLDFAAATEGSLKMKEISYIHSEAYAAGELKHGTISLVEKGTLIVALACHEPLFAKTMSNIREVVSRGARILAVTTDRHKDEMKDFDFVLTVPETLLPFCASLEVVVLQLLAYYASLYRGCDIDKPRNLAKSVTVE